MCKWKETDTILRESYWSVCLLAYAVFIAHSIPLAASRRMSDVHHCMEMIRMAGTPWEQLISSTWVYCDHLMDEEDSSALKIEPGHLRYQYVNTSRRRYRPRRSSRLMLAQCQCAGSTMCRRRLAVTMATDPQPPQPACSQDTMCYIGAAYYDHSLRKPHAVY